MNKQNTLENLNKIDPKSNQYLKKGSQKYKDLKKVNLRVHHLMQSFPTFLDEETALKLENDPLKIAQEQLRRGTLEYLKIY